MKEKIIKAIEKSIKEEEEYTHDEDDAPTDELSEGIILGLERALDIVLRMK